jgi:topoisomerase (DNA) II binding protein 1
MAVGRREGGPPFQGLRVFLPRNYLPPERYSALQDALTHQGAEVFLNLNPYSKSSVDYHVLADELKIKDMREKGCRVVGPECVLRCAREFRRLPDRDYTCCLALEGVSVLLTGFAGDEKKELEELVLSMHGTLQQQTVPDVDFVVAKDVLATKYKWACEVVRKPVLMASWLRQCAREHRQLPHDPHRMLPLAGLTICATGILFEDRYRMQDAAQKNGAAYHADLTKECSHLIAVVPDGRKYEAAVNWGLKVVAQNWFWESIKHKMSLDETLFPVVAPTVGQDTRVVAKEVLMTGPSPSPASNNGVSGSKEQEVGVSGDVDPERRLSVGKDAMYLSGCRFFLTGLSAAEMRKLVNLVLAGGGTRHMEMNDTITHVILGASVPESNMKEIRQLAMWGVVHILQPGWLEECTRQRREVEPELYRVPQNLLLQGKESARVAGAPQSGRGGLVDAEAGHDATSSAKVNGAVGTRLEEPASTGALGLPGPTPRIVVNKLFSGHVFGFVNDFPADQRAEIVRRVLEHGGVWEANAASAEYVLAPHGAVLPVERTASTMKYVSKYWVSWCVEEGKLLDVQSHTLFRPLSCQIPLADFQGARFCVSQYSDRDRKLLRKLCQVLRVKFTETLNSKVTHLLCKVQAGEKFENAERMGIPCVTADWLYACAAQNMAVSMDLFKPREPTAAEKEAEHSFMTQRPVRAAGVLPSHAADLQTQVSNQSNPGSSQSLTFTSKSTKQTSRAKAPVRRSSRPSGTSTDHSLSSQARGTLLDPWDASAPAVAEAGGSKLGVKPSQESISQLRPATGRSSLRASTRSMQSGDGSLKPNTGERSVAGSSKAQEPLPIAPELDSSEADHENAAVAGESNSVEIAGAVDSNVMDNNNNSDEGTANVVDAIEGLLRQTSKVKGGELVEVLEVRKDLISPEAATLGRRTREETHTHSDNFKKPKLYPSTRSSKVDGDSKSPPAPAPHHEDSLRFDESQLDSQMVAYDEDHSERQNLMERVRTRSSSIALSSNNSVGARQTDKSAAAWKGDQKLGRLFKAAEANK